MPAKATPKPSRLRCAIYTRKSSEEGLEQDFNSLHAQREACEAYVKSQQHEGWKCLPAHYDDGGISGATMDRPALQQLLGDIRTKKIDIVVVYKVDRLTRSLADFAKMVEIFDEAGASFVSVTQQFNTTTSMGRLTLNVLLSFAQFEREVTGERIRDKIAASKKKGMWMGGFVPLGYDAKDRTLIIKSGEAETVRTLFTLYRRLGSVAEVKREADRLGLRTKSREDVQDRWKGGRPFSRGHIYQILSNRLYIGEIPHKDQSYAGRHAAIIDRDLWDEVQATLKEHTRREGSGGAKHPSLLSGLLFDSEGNRLVPSHAVNHGRRYRYYVSAKKDRHGNGHTDTWRLPADQIETVVVDQVTGFLEDEHRVVTGLELDDLGPNGLTEVIRKAQEAAAVLRGRDRMARRARLIELVDRIGLHQDKIETTMRCEFLSGTSSNEVECPTIALVEPLRMKRRGIELKLIVDRANAPSAPDNTLIKALVRAHIWWPMLRDGQATSVRDLAQQVGNNERYVAWILNLAFLSPKITEAIMAGRQPPDVTVDRIIKRTRLPLDWSEQTKVLGFSD